MSLRHSFAFHWPIFVLLGLCLVIVLPGGKALIGHPLGDMSSHFWGGWWFGTEILSGRLPLWATQTHMPSGGTFYYIDPIGGLLMLLLRPLGPALAWNGMILLQLIGTACCGYLLGFSIDKNKIHGFVLGTMLLSSSYVLGSLHTGAAEYFGFGLPCLFIWSLRDSLQSKKWKRTSLLIGLCTIQAFYYGAFACLLCFCLCVSTKKNWPIGVKVLLAGLVLSTPAIATGWWTLGTASATANQGIGNPHLPVIPFKHWLPFVASDEALHNPGIRPQHAFHLTTLVLIGIALYRNQTARTWGKNILLFSILVLGPVFAWQREGASTDQIYLPAALLYLPDFSPFQWIHHPYRGMAFLLPIWGIAAVKGLSYLPRNTFILAIFCLLTESFYTGDWPVVTTPLPRPIQVEESGYRLNWPPSQAGGRNLYLREQVYHQQPIATGVNILIPPRVREDPLVQRLESIFDRNTTPSSKASALPSLGFSTLVLHKEFLPPKRQKQVRILLEEEFGREIAETRDYVVYVVK